MSGFDSSLSLWERVPEGRERAMSGANGLCVGKRRRLTLRVSPHPPFGHLPPEGEGWVLP